MPAFKPPGDCPICGEYVPRGLVACPACGSCAKSGWRADAEYDGLDLPDDPADFDYDDFVAREFGGKTKDRWAPGGLWWWAALAVLIALVLAALSGWW